MVLLMEIQNYFWPDSQLIKMQIEYDCANVLIWNEVLQKKLLLKCSGFAGMTNLCIWDDTIIMSVQLYSVEESGNDFINQLYATYDKNINYGGRSLKDGLLELRIGLVNYTFFSIYCQKVEVLDSVHEKRDI